MGAARWTGLLATVTALLSCGPSLDSNATGARGLSTTTSPQSTLPSRGPDAPRPSIGSLPKETDRPMSDAGMAPVPTTLEECFFALEQQLPAEMLAAMRAGSEDDMVQYHMSVGRWMRNRWGLWSGGPLGQSLRNLGLQHPDDMSGLILGSFWCHLHGLPLRVPERVAAAQDYWRRMTPPKPAKAPECDTEIDFRVIQSTKGDGGPERQIHAGRCARTGKLWAWELDRGWFEPESPLREMLLKSLGP